MLTVTDRGMGRGASRVWCLSPAQRAMAAAKGANVSLSKQVLGQPGATWGNLKDEVAPVEVACREWFRKTWGNRGNLFESLTHARGGKTVSRLCEGSWQKVAPVAPEPCKQASDSGLAWG